MLHRLKEPFGKAGLIVAIVALVAATVGGAYAASGSGDGNATASAKKNKKSSKGKRGPKGPKGAKGDPGAPGAQGPAGAAGRDGLNGLDGIDGEDGADGADGTSGTDGVSVTSSVEPAGANCADGGSKFEAASGTTYACNGEDGADGEQGPEGSPWTAGGTLPSEETETGVWSFGTVVTAPTDLLNEPILVPISFPIPLTDPLAGANVHYLNGAGKEMPGETTSTTCLGSVAEPTAEPGHLCVYVSGASVGEGTKFIVGGTNNPGANPAVPGAARSGATIQVFVPQAGARAFGTWAVTAP